MLIGSCANRVSVESLIRMGMHSSVSSLSKLSYSMQLTQSHPISMLLKTSVPHRRWSVSYEYLVLLKIKASSKLERFSISSYYAPDIHCPSCKQVVALVYEVTRKLFTRHSSSEPLCLVKHLGCLCYRPSQHRFDTSSWQWQVSCGLLLTTGYCQSIPKVNTVVSVNLLPKVNVFEINSSINLKGPR